MTGQTGDSFTINMSSSQLVMASAANKGGVRMRDLTPGEDFKLDVKVFDITGDFALAKTFNAKYGFFDYCQLAKFNGEWKIPEPAICHTPGSQSRGHGGPDAGTI